MQLDLFACLHFKSLQPTQCSPVDYNSNNYIYIVVSISNYYKAIHEINTKYYTGKIKIANEK